jgi:pimeloyl-ACP methyl ester carboxylesterase
MHFTGRLAEEAHARAAHDRVLLGHAKAHREDMDRAECIVYDRRGSFRSERPEPYATSDVSDHADDVGALLDTLSATPAVVIGRSYGGGIALDLARRYPGEDRSGAKLVALVANVRAAGPEITGHEVLKTAPRGYPKDHPRIELLRFKGLITWREWPAGAWLGTRQAKTRVAEFFRLSKPLNEWLLTHVGPSSLPERPA